MISPTTLGARPRLGSSRMMTDGSDISARAMASICCSPPDKAPASRIRSRRRGKRCSASSRRRHTAILAPHVAAEDEVVLDRERREDQPVLGDVGQAEGRDLLGAGRRDVGVTELDVPLAGTQNPETDRRTEVLPAPLAPTRARISPGATCRSIPCRTCSRSYAACRPVDPQPMRGGSRVIARPSRVPLVGRVGRRSTGGTSAVVVFLPR
jgi:hypothetical protein